MAKKDGHQQHRKGVKDAKATSRPKNDDYSNLGPRPTGRDDRK